jgi:hypothetical protein
MAGPTPEFWQERFTTVVARREQTRGPLRDSMKAPSYRWICYRCSAASAAGTSACTSCGSPANVSGKDIAPLAPAGDAIQLLPLSLTRAMQSAPSLAALALALSVCLAFCFAYVALLCWDRCGMADDVVLTAFVGTLTAACWYVNARAAIRASVAGSRRRVIAFVLLLPAIVVTTFATYLLGVLVVGIWVSSAAHGR